MKIKNKDFNIVFQNRGSKKGEILIYDQIGENWFGEGVTAKAFAKGLKALGAVDEIDVRIASDGGSVFDGVTIYNQLVNHSATITVHIDGQALSIASVIAMAGDTIKMASNGFLMIHEPHTVAMGDAHELRKVAETLDIVRDQIVGTYHDNRGIDKKILEDWVAEEKWFTADEALEVGFVDEITGAMEIAAHYDYSKYHNTPKVLTNPDKHAHNAPQAKGKNGASAAIARMRTSLKARNLA